MNLRKSARKLAAEAEMPATEEDIEAAIALYQFERAADGPNPAAGEQYAGAAFDLARQETGHCVAHLTWIESLIEAGHLELADTWTVKYLEFIPESGAVGERLAGDIDFWAGHVLRGNRGKLPRSAAVFAKLFPPAKSVRRRRN